MSVPEVTPPTWRRPVEPAQPELDLAQGLRVVVRRRERPRRRVYAPRRLAVPEAFVRLPVEVLRDPALSDGAKILWGYLATYATGADLEGRGGLVQQPNGLPLALGQLVADRDAGQATIRRQLGELVAAGHVTARGQSGGRLTIRVLWISTNPPQKRAQK